MTFEIPPNEPIDLPDPPLHPALLTVRVDLVGAEPAIWRRLELRGDLTLRQVHEVLQVAMGWNDTHLHRFFPTGVPLYGRPHFVNDFEQDEGEPGTAESAARLDQVLRATGESITYLYDFGDDWEHSILVEQLRPATADDPPADCLAGENAGPLDDIGGIDIWNQLSAALRANPDPQALSGELRMYADWLPLQLDPANFDADLADLMISLIGVEPEALREHINAGRTADGLEPIPALHPNVDDVIAKSPPDLVLHLSMLTVQALDAPIPTPEQLTSILRPWQSVLDAATPDGIALTKAGWISPASCEYIWQHSGLAWDYGKGNREQHTPEVHLLREEALRIKLLRKNKDRLVLTATGRRASTSSQSLAECVGRGLVQDRTDFDQHARVLLLLLIAAGWTPETDTDDLLFGEQEALLDEVARLLTEVGWQVGPGPVHRHELGRSVHEVLTLLTNEMPHRAHYRAIPNSTGARYLARLALFVPD